jgi:hypothetical protein
MKGNGIQIERCAIIFDAKYLAVLRLKEVCKGTVHCPAINCMIVIFTL